MSSETPETPVRVGPVPVRVHITKKVRVVEVEEDYSDHFVSLHVERAYGYHIVPQSMECSVVQMPYGICCADDRP